MSPGAQMRTLLSNETRALLPAWIAAVLAAGIAALTRGDVHEFSLLAFITATIGIGAQSIGHEYAHRTLGLMLTLPISRRRLFFVKMIVVGAMVLPLAICARLLGLFPDVPALPWLVAGAALCLAPSLTMLCRSQLAGMVFSASLPGTIFTVVTIITSRTFDASAETERTALVTWSRLMIPILASGAVLGWRLFMRLESIDGGATGIHLKWWTGTTRDAGPRHPLWQLVKKELRLQQMTFAVTGLCLAICTAGVMLHLPGPGRHVSFVAAATAVYALGLPALVGSLATAEERQLGTLAWQLQLPTPAWQQWAAKVGTVFSLTLLLSIGVPLLLVPTLSPTERPFIEVPAVLAVVMTASSMYISSLCATAVRAVVTSVVAVSFILWLVLKAELWSGRESASVALLAVVVAVLVGFAFVNHRPEPPSAARIWRQTLSLAALVGVGLVVLEAARF